MTVWVAMPAFNEGPRLPALLSRWTDVLHRLNTAHRYVIVDDGSRDDTADVLRTYARTQPLEIITHRVNSGLGASLRHLLHRVAQAGQNDDVVVMMDADNTQSPELLPSMFACMDETRCDVVIASRFRAGADTRGVGLLRQATSVCARLAFRVVFPIPGVRDYTCGYRLYRLSVIRRAFDALGDQFCDRAGFECTADILLQLARLGATFREVPMVLHYGPKRDASTMRVASTIATTLSLMLRRRFERR